MFSDILIKIKVMRLPFVTASVIPYLIGAAFVFRTEGSPIFHFRFFLGLCAVVCCHLGANVFNEYFDAKSGNDWQDVREHVFFGGSKVIQKGLLREEEVFRIGMVLAAVAASSVIALQFLIPDVPIVLFGCGILAAAFFYSAPPLKLVYRGFGEFVIFILFGTAIVAGAYTILTQRLFGLREIILSLPISFLVTAILYVNEVPDYWNDKNVAKNNWVVLSGPNVTWMGYLALISGSFVSVIVCVLWDILPAVSLGLLPLFGIFIRPVLILKNGSRDLEKLKVSSALTIFGHTLIGFGLILTLVLSSRFYSA